MFPQSIKTHMKYSVTALLVAIVGCGAALIQSTRATTDTLDKTDCQGAMLDDSAFREPVVRDHSDKSYGALANSAMLPLGGGQGYRHIVPVPRPQVVGLSAGAVI
ncbi:MAG: hypothetical protein WAM70_20015, partial [Pyrinomonadaceae bacterium]